MLLVYVYATNMKRFFPMTVAKGTKFKPLIAVGLMGRAPELEVADIARNPEIPLDDTTLALTLVLIVGVFVLFKRMAKMCEHPPFVA